MEYLAVTLIIAGDCPILAAMANWQTRSESRTRRIGSHSAANLDPVSVKWKRRHRVGKPAGKEWRAARAGCPCKRRDAASGLPDATPRGRAEFGPAQRCSSVTMLWHCSLLAPRAEPNSAPCRCFHFTETGSSLLPQVSALFSLRFAIVHEVRS